VKQLRGHKSEGRGVGEIGDDFLEFAVVAALDAALGSAGEELLHLSPVFPVLEHVPGDGQILLERELPLADVRTQVVEETLPDLLGRELLIAKDLLGRRALMSFHFSPHCATSRTTASSSLLVQLRSLQLSEMRLYRL
jgi:hypothetical protein